MEIQYKRCCTCASKQPITEFYRLKSSPDGRYPNCILCYRKSRVPQKKAIKAGRRKWERKIREEAIAYYGPNCACCLEGQFEFLSIRRIEDNAPVEGPHTPDPYWLKRKGWPDGFHVLCHNCHHTLNRYGYCPHGGIGFKGYPQSPTA